MPELDGWGVLKNVQQAQLPPRVIIITAHGKDDTARIAKEKGAWTYVEKPYIIENIKALLRGDLNGQVFPYFPK
jgi:two-component system response regulator PilR (NtrC family)